jgi:predicted nucleotidyltransferase
MSKVKELTEQVDSFTPPKWLPNRVKYEALAGSHAYGTADEESDKDIVGFCTPPKEYLFPHLAGNIPGFGRQKRGFEHFEQNAQDTEWDADIFNLVHYVNTCMESNPKWLEGLFIPEEQVLTSSDISDKLRANRELFLHKGCFYSFTGFATSQIHKMKGAKDKDSKTDRQMWKYAYHAVRLVDELEEILTERTLTLNDNVDKLISIRRGEWTLDEVEQYVEGAEERLEALYEDSTALPYEPDGEALKELLISCLRMEYGDMKELRDVEENS